jgi:hypothetical protein
MKSLELIAMERRRKRGQGDEWYDDTMQRSREDTGRLEKRTRGEEWIGPDARRHSMERGSRGLVPRGRVQISGAKDWKGKESMETKRRTLCCW